jgi:putative transcriptional regulator
MMYHDRKKRWPSQGAKKSLWRLILTLLTLASIIIIIDGSASVNATPDKVHKTDQLASRPTNPAQPPPDVLAIPARGRLLIASKRLQEDPRFRETVVLLVQYSSSGAMGLIINKPTALRLADILKDQPTLQNRKDVVFYGGPVEVGSLFLLLQSTAIVVGSFKVLDGVHMSTSRAVLEQLIVGKLNVPFRSYVGYAGWAPGQLEAEIAHGDWYVTKADARIIFEQDPALLWPQLMRTSVAMHV